MKFKERVKPFAAECQCLLGFLKCFNQRNSWCTKNENNEGIVFSGVSSILYRKVEKKLSI